MATDVSMPIYLAGSFIFVAVGTGAIKPNVMNFGATQYDENDPVEVAQRESFFSYFYLTINIGAFIAYGFLINLSTSESTSASPGSGYFKAYVIAAVAMGIAVLAFVSGTPKYTGKGGVTRTPMISVIRKHLVEAAQRSWLGVMAVAGWVLMPLSMLVVLLGSLLSSMPSVSSTMTWTAFGLALSSCALLVMAHWKNDYIAELPKGWTAARSGGISAGDVKAALAMMPTILCVNVGFRIPANAINAFPAQACQMNTVFFGQQINGAFWNIGDCVAILVGVPILEQFILPAVQRLRGGRPVSASAKYCAGFAFVILANLSAIAIEWVRRAKSPGENPSFVPCPVDLWGSDECSNGYLLSHCSPGDSLPMTDMSSFWTVVPMFLIGFGEILVNPTVYS
mmetsp:Transcript_37159/g.95969  ORF Transcript_37159/g.95969 Transcript_37159/m.95969 type:complete len:396 (+) Transcript_37159:690-1877(+)